jgi:hypothetical protein
VDTRAASTSAGEHVNHGEIMPLEAINQEMETSFTENVLSALLTAEEREAERHAAHPIASIAAVCGCETN